ncbi:hypothetical protein FRC00_009456, partial [Tulasnella sp. 408]
MSHPPMDEDVPIADDSSDSGSDMDLGSSYVGGGGGGAIALNDAASTIYPDDSISMRDFQTAKKKKRPPAPSVVSDAPSLFKTVHGRAFNNQSDLYILPADDHEHSRLDMQHLALRLHLGSLYASKHLVEAALKPNPNCPPAVLDVGTGSGRCADTGINNFESWLYEVARTLRPNGVLLLVNGFPQMYDSQLQPLPTVEPGEEGFTWVQFLCCPHWQRWLESNPNYKTPRTRSMYVPMGPWKENMSEREQYISALMREDCIRILGNFKPLLLSDGKKEADVDQWVANATKELHDLSVHSYSRWQYTVAVRNILPWQERLEEPRPLDAESGTMLGRASDTASAPSGIAE